MNRAVLDALEARRLFTQTIIVNSLGDGAPTAGITTLRQAITQVNADALSTPAAPDTISFSGLPGTGTFALNSVLPNITRPVIIDGTTAPGFNFATGAMLQLDGADPVHIVAGSSGFTFLSNGSSSTVKGFKITGWTGSGLDLNGASTMTVVENWIGTNTGEPGPASGNHVGITIEGNGQHNQIGDSSIVDGGNIISGNITDGIDIIGSTSTDETIDGNRIGIDAHVDLTADDVALANGRYGISVAGGQATITNNTISGNGSDGIHIDAPAPTPAATITTINGNTIGLGVDSAGSDIAIGNGRDGIYLANATGIVIGGTTGNTVSGNAGNGIEFFKVTKSSIVKELIGTDTTGSFAIGNGAGPVAAALQTAGSTYVDGVFIGNGSTANKVGTPGNGNTISGNGDLADNIGGGVDVDATSLANSIQANLIGTDATNSFSVPNATYGILAASKGTASTGANSGTLIGGLSSPFGAFSNDISGNLGDGIDITGNYNTVQGNNLGGNGIPLLGNQGNGIVLSGGAQHNLIGVSKISGTTSAPAVNVPVPGGNSIENNRGEGVIVDGATTFDDSILNNSINDNGGLGIDLINGGNHNLAAPVINLVQVASGHTTVSFSLNVATAGTYYVQFFSEPDADPSGVGEGETALGTVQEVVATPGLHTYTTTLTTPLAIAPLATDFISSTVTQYNGSVPLDTSPFSNVSKVGNVPGLSITPSVTHTISTTTTTSYEFDVTLTQPSSTPVTVTYYTSDGTAIGSLNGGSDYITQGTFTNPQTITFNPGETTKPIFITVNPQTIAATDKTFSVNLKSVTSQALGANNAVLVGTQGVGIIHNAVATTLASVAINSPSITNSAAGGVLHFTVTRTGNLAATASVDFQTADGSAVAGTDYTATNGTVTFAPNQATADVAVTVLGSAAVASDKTVLVNLSNPVSLSISQGQGTGTIHSATANPVPTLSIASPPTVTRGNAAVSTTPVSFTVTRAGDLTQTSTATFTTQDGTAKAGTDYIAATGVVTFNPGQNTASFTVNVLGTAANTPALTFTVSLSNPVDGAIINGGQATATIAAHSTGVVATGGALINAGGGQTGSFIGDTDVSGGSTFGTGNAINLSNVPVASQNQAVFQSERYGNFTYTVPGLTPGGQYTVALDFSENFPNESASRIFNVTINGAAALTNFNIASAAGGNFTGVQKTFTANANASGQVVINFSGVNGSNAKVDGVEVTPTGGVVVPPPAITSASINAGGGATANYASDNGFSGGSTFGTGNFVTPALASQDEGMLQTERYGNTFSYTVAGLTAGATYTVKLDFAENFPNEATTRVFNVFVNGVQKLTNYNIYSDAGNVNFKGVEKVLSGVADSQGKVVISFQGVGSSNAKVDGIIVS